jgi:hypothetical protein
MVALLPHVLPKLRLQLTAERPTVRRLLEDWIPGILSSVKVIIPSREGKED